MTDKKDKRPQKPQASFQVTDAENKQMKQDAIDIGDTVSNILRRIKNKYWAGDIKNMKAALRK